MQPQPLPKEDQPITVEEHLRTHNIGDHATLARLIAEHPNNTSDQGERSQ